MLESQRSNVASVRTQICMPSMEVRHTIRGAKIKLEIQRVEVVNEINRLIPGKRTLVDFCSDVDGQCNQEHSLLFLSSHGLGLCRG